MASEARKGTRYSLTVDVDDTAPKIEGPNAMRLTAQYHADRLLPMLTEVLTGVHHSSADGYAVRMYRSTSVTVSECRGCKFADPNRVVVKPFGDIEHTRDESFLVCRRSAPAGPLYESNSSQWPRVESTDWCGEFKEA